MKGKNLPLDISDFFQPKDKWIKELALQSHCLNVISTAYIADPKAKQKLGLGLGGFIFTLDIKINHFCVLFGFSQKGNPLGHTNFV